MRGRRFIIGLAVIAAIALPHDLRAAPTDELFSGGEAAIVLELQAPSQSDLVVFGLLKTGRQIRLEANEVLLLGYQESCVVERITGGTVTVGIFQSKVDDGAVERAKTDCALFQYKNTAAQLQHSAVSVIERVADPATAPAPRDNSDSVAVIIGNRNYDGGIPAVAYAHRDAEAVKRYLIDVMGYRVDNIIDLRNATKSKMESTFGNRDTHEGSKLWSYVKPDLSHITVFYSGHGVPGIRDRRGYLLPVDADPDTPEINGYPLDVLYQNLGNLEAKSVTVLLDACFSGETAGGWLIKSASPVTVQANLPNAGPNFTVLTAAGSGELASWDEENKHGLFTWHLLQALNGKADKEPFGDGDGVVTVAETKAYLDREMTHAARRNHRRIQHASVQGDYHVPLGVVPAAGPAQSAVAALTPGADISALDKTMVVASDRVNVRSGPGIQFDRVASLTRDTEVTVTGHVRTLDQDWYRVMLEPGQDAFILSSLLKDSSGLSPGSPAPGAPRRDPAQTPRVSPGPQESFDRLATTLLATIPSGQRIAVRPLAEEETGLTKRQNDALYDRLLASLFSISGGRHRFVERESLKAIFDSAAEFANIDIEGLLSAVRADIDVLCDVAPSADSVEVACRAIDLLQAMVVGRGEAIVDLPSSVLDLNEAMRFLADEIWSWTADAGSFRSTGFRDQQTGVVSDLGQHVADLLLERLYSKLEVAVAERKKEQAFQRAIAPDKPTEQPPVRDYQIHGVIWTLDDDHISVRALVKLRGQTVATRSVLVAAGTVPLNLREPVARRVSGFHKVVAEAVAPADGDPKRAVWAAQNLARARVIAAATGAWEPAVTTVVDQADAIHLLGHLAYGVTHDERFLTIWNGNRVSVTLNARVAPVGSPAAPALTAHLDKAIYGKDETKEITLSFDTTGHFGVFAWFPDNTIVRLHPRRAGFGVPGGKSVTLRLLGHQTQGPEGAGQHHVIVVIASDEQSDFQTLASLAGDTLSESWQYAVPARSFLGALGRKDLTRARIIMLPYMVRS